MTDPLEIIARHVAAQSAELASLRRIVGAMSHENADLRLRVRTLESAQPVAQPRRIVESDGRVVVLRGVA